MSTSTQRALDPDRCMRGWYPRWGKRLFDVLLAAPALLALLPIMGLCWVLIRLTSPGPALFRQMRLGRHGRLFALQKFRTMTDKPRVPDREIVAGDPEVTAVGAWLRRFKLDELPQLFSVVRGDLSLVGPRPALPSQREELDEYGVRRLLVRPGVTGLAQVNGNISLSWKERWRYDAQYVARVSFSLDAWIILKTIAVVLLGEERFRRRIDREPN